MGNKVITKGVVIRKTNQKDKENGKVKKEGKTKNIIIVKKTIIIITSQIYNKTSNNLMNIKTINILIQVTTIIINIHPQE